MVSAVGGDWDGGPRLSVGVLTADLARLGGELAILRGTGCWAHVDVMDGSFCPMLTVGPAFAGAVAATGVPVDVHLLVDEPRRLLPEVMAAGPAVVTVHAEATRHLYRTMTELTSLAADQPAPVLRGVAIGPGTPVWAVEPVLELADLVLVLAVDPGWPGQRPAPGTPRRLAAVRGLAAGLGRKILLGVDGGVTMANAAQVAGWGADVVVSGSAIYDGTDPPANLDRMLARLRKRDAAPAAAGGNGSHKPVRAAAGP